MFENPGGKLKGLALVNFAVVFIVGIVCGTIIGEDNSAIMVLLWLVGFFVAWVGSIVLYGFGELVETNSLMARGEDKAELERDSYEGIIELTPVDIPSEDEVCECCKSSTETKVYRYSNKSGTAFINICDDCLKNRADEIQKMVRK